MDNQHLPDELGDEDAYALDQAQVAAALRAVDARDQIALSNLMEPLHPADIADLLEQISATDRARLIALFDREFDGEILSELDESIREEVIETLHPQVLVDAVRELESDDVVDLLEDLEEEQQEAILDALDDPDRAAIEQSLSYGEETAGRLMQREVVFGSDLPQWDHPRFQGPDRHRVSAVRSDVAGGQSRVRVSVDGGARGVLPAERRLEHRVQCGLHELEQHRHGDDPHGL